MSFSLEGYFQRIDYQGGESATLDTLHQLHFAHTCTIPFENLDALQNITPQLDDASIYQKIVVAGRGGWCFEQNALFNRVLCQLGFDVTGLSARVLLANPAVLPARTHRLLQVRVQQEVWIADVGFGGKTTPVPLRLVADVKQQTSHGLYSFSQQDNTWYLHYHDGDLPLTLYCFNLEGQCDADYQMANHYVATWPESHFRRALTLSLFLPQGGRTTLYSNAESPEVLADARRLYADLQEAFNLRLDHPVFGINYEAFREIIERLRVERMALALRQANGQYCEIKQ